jgi:hypothetical protein
MAEALSQLSRHLASTIEAASRAVVAVHGRGRLASSGIIWEPGLVVTAEEAVERDTDLAVTLPDGRRVEATLAGPRHHRHRRAPAGGARRLSRDGRIRSAAGHLAVAAGDRRGRIRRVNRPSPAAHGTAPTAERSTPSCGSI